MLIWQVTMQAIKIVSMVAKDSASEETEFVDLGLPSGTLWASDYVKDG